MAKSRGRWGWMRLQEKHAPTSRAAMQAPCTCRFTHTFFLMITSPYLNGVSRLYKLKWWLNDKVWLQSLKIEDMTVSTL